MAITVSHSEVQGLPIELQLSASGAALTLDDVAGDLLSILPFHNFYDVSPTINDG